MLSIIPLQAEAVSTLLSILIRAFEQFRETLIPPSSAFKETEASILKKLEQGGGFLACVDGQAVACVLYELREDYVYLGRLAVLPDYRGQGIAKALIQVTENIAQENTIGEVRVNVRSTLTSNQQLFESLNYRIIAQHKHAGYENPTYVEMSKKLLEIESHE